MNELRYLEKKVTETLDFLVKDIGLSTPRIRRDSSGITINYMGYEISFEIKIDWRDFAIFVLLVRLEDGNLPDGYYLSKGKKCRKYLEQVLREHFDYKTSSIHTNSSKQRDIQNIEKQLSFYEEVLREYAGSILRLKYDLFE